MCLVFSDEGMKEYEELIFAFSDDPATPEEFADGEYEALWEKYLAGHASEELKKELAEHEAHRKELEEIARTTGRVWI